MKTLLKARLLNLRDNEAIRLNSWRFGRIARIPIAQIFPCIEGVQVTIMNTFDRTPGISLDPLEILYLTAIAKITRAEKICEIGTYDGNTILNLAANTSENAYLVTIDLPHNWEGNFAIPIAANRINVTDRDKTALQYKNTRFEEKITQVFCDSAILDWKNLGGPFDLIFIDGCHDYRYVKHDSENAYEYLSNKGIIVWHDYGMIADVSDFVDSFCDNLLVKVIAGTRLAIGFKKDPRAS